MKLNKKQLIDLISKVPIEKRIDVEPGVIYLINENYMYSKLPKKTQPRFQPSQGK